ILASVLGVVPPFASAVPGRELQKAAGRDGSIPALSPALAATRKALDRYRDPIVAVHDGYFSTLGCIEYSTAGGHGDMEYKSGGMGVHFLNPAFIGPTLDSLKPQVLIYEPVGDKLRLVAAEWFERR